MIVTLDRDFKIYLLKCIKEGAIDTENEHIKQLQMLVPFTIEHVSAKDELERLELIRSQFKDIPAKCGECKYRKTITKFL